jgi:tetratricopeptide (TPR) repeat protein
MQPTLHELRPLYQAVAHGCNAGIHQKAFDEVYWKRIQRGNEAYSTKSLGAFGANLGALACFFDQPWSRISSALSETIQAWVINETAYCLRALGRLSEAIEPMQDGLEMSIKTRDWKNAAIRSENLSNLELTQGKIIDAICEAERSVEFANYLNDLIQVMSSRVSLANVLNQAGRSSEAIDHFRAAKSMQIQLQPSDTFLDSQVDFNYCELLLAETEYLCWCAHLQAKLTNMSKIETLRNNILEVEIHAENKLKWASSQNWLCDIALNHLTLGRVNFYRAILSDLPSQKAECLEISRKDLDAAVDGLRQVGFQVLIPNALLSRARHRLEQGDVSGAKADLNEAWDVAERGPMRLHMADIHLHRARMFRDKEDLEKARALIEECGYWRRKEELDYAEMAAKNW